MPEAVVTAIAEYALEYLGAAAFDAVVSTAIFVGTYGTYIAIAASVYTLREQQRRAKNAYNNGLRDRYVMQRSATAQRQMVMGRARVSGPITFMHSYGNNNTTLAMCLVLAGHECDGIEDIYFNDTPVILDGSGNVIGTKNIEHFTISGTNATFTLGAVGTAGTQSAVATYDTGDVSLAAVMSGDGKTLTISGGTAGKIGSVIVTYQPYVVVYTPTRIQDTNTQQTASGSTGSFGVPSNCVTASVAVVGIVGNAQTALSFTRTGNTINYTGATAGQIVHLMYQAGTTYSRARIRKYLGGSGQTADSGLISSVSDLWTSNHVGVGLTYLVVELDYDPGTFPSGIPNISAVVRGLKCYDPRTTTTAWTDNPALLMRAYYTHPLGAARSTSEVNDTAIIAAANVCDGSVTYTVGTHKKTCARYKGATVAAKDRKPQDVLTDLAHAMGGRWVISGNQLVVRSGVYTSPVASIDDSWVHSGSPVSMQPRPNRADLTNSITGSFADEEQAFQTIAFPTVKAAAYITADGKELQSQIDYPAVTYCGQAQYLAASAIRYNRAGLTVKMSCNMRAFPLEVFDIVNVSLTRFGWINKTFEVLATGFSIDGLVELTLKEIDSTIWALDAAFLATDYAVKTQLPSPWVLPVPVIGAIASGTNYLLKQADGTITSRIYVPFTAITDNNVLQGGFVDVSYMRAGDPDLTWNTVSVAGDATSAIIAGVNDGAVYIIKSRTRNRLAEGNWSTQVAHQVVGKTAAPANVSGFALAIVPGALKGARTPSVEVDYDHTIYRYGATFSGGTTVPGTSDRGGFVWPWPALGSYTVWAADVDSTGNLGTPVSQAITVDSSILIGAGSAGGALLNNLIDVAWWSKQDATIPWGLNAEYNRIVACSPVTTGVSALQIAGPKGGNDVVWYCAETTGDGSQGGGWENVPIALDPAKSYRFVVPIRRLNGTAASMWWGTRNVEMLDGSANTNPYFAGSLRPDYSDRWYLFVGYIYPAGAAGNTSDSAGVWDCKTGAKVAGGTNYRFKAGDGNVYHRAYQFYASNLADQAFGRPFVNLVDGTEPSLREYFEEGAVLNSTLIPSITAAQSAADAAASNATSALTQLTNIASDNILSPSEKPPVIQDYAVITGEQSGIDAQANAYSITTEKTAYDTAVAALTTYLGTLSGWNTVPGSDVAIVGTTFRSKFTDVYAARQAVLNKIAAVAGTLATWAGVGSRPVNLTTLTGGENLINHDAATLLGFNPSFTPWTGTFPAAWASWAGSLPTKDTTTFAGLPWSVKWTVTASDVAANNVGMQVQYNCTTAPMPAGTFVTGSFTAVMLNGTSGAAPGYLIRLFTNAAQTAFVDTPVGITNPSVGGVQKMPFTASSNGSPIYGIQIYQMAGWSGLPGGMTPAGTSVAFGPFIMAINTPMPFSNVGGINKPADNATRNTVYYQDTDPGAVADGSIWISSTKSYQRVSGAWQPYVGSLSVGTGELVLNAATVIYASSVTGPVYVTGAHHAPTNGLGYWTLIGSLTFTPDSSTSGSVELLLTATGQCNLTAGALGSDFCNGYLGDNTNTTPDNAAIQLIPIVPASSTTASGFAHSLRITHAGNTSVTVGLWAQVFGSGSGSSCYVTNLNLRAEVIKR